MRVTFAYNSDAATVRKRIDEEAVKVMEKSKGRVSDAHYTWEGDTMAFTATAMGTTVNGTLEVTPTEVIVDAHMPMFLRPFEGQAKSRILGQLHDMFDRT